MNRDEPDFAPGDAPSIMSQRIQLILDQHLFPGGQRGWCLAAGLSSSYLSASRSRGKDGGTAREIAKLAMAAGVTVEWLIGASDRPSGGADPLFDDFTKECQLRPGLSDALISRPRAWHLTTVARALHVAPKDLSSATGWTELLDKLEAGTTPNVSTERAVRNHLQGELTAMKAKRTRGLGPKRPARLP